MDDRSGRVDSKVAVSDDDRFRLRRFIDDLPSDEIEVRQDAVDLVAIAPALENNARAVLFRSVGPEGAELVGNVTSSRARFALAFGVAPRELSREIMRRLRNVPEVVEVPRAAAPVQQIVLTGADADFTTLPVNLQHGRDGGPYISSGLDYAIDRRTGMTNLGARRLMLRGRHEAGVDLVAPSDLRAIYEAAVSRGERLPVSFAVGCHPIDHVAATLKVPVDELGLVSTLRAAPLAVVRCVTNDIRVPADSEYVLEGYLDERGHVEKEGPYGEFLGYYGGVKRNPVFHLTAITRRRDALFQTSSIGGRTMSRTDTAQISALRTEVMMWRALETAVREPVAVHATTSSGGSFNVRIALRQRVPGEARNAINAAFGSLANVKNVFVVDPDIDVTSDEQMDWAMATRFQGDRDIVVGPGMRTLPLDPSLGGRRTGAKTGFDMTWEFGSASRIETSVPAPPLFDGRRFDSLRDALAEGPKYFEELMAALGSRDGREIVVALDALRADFGIKRDEYGRYVMGAAS
jgi:2,5-furandicarboxylate decarboxylase 1